MTCRDQRWIIGVWVVSMRVFVSMCVCSMRVVVCVFRVCYEHGVFYNIRRGILYHMIWGKSCNIRCGMFCYIGCGMLHIGGSYLPGTRSGQEILICAERATRTEHGWGGTIQDSTKHLNNEIAP